jgi:enoyl-CoA hydratase
MREEYTMSEPPHLLVREEDGILICTMNRPAKLNALTSDLFDRLGAAVVRLRDEPHLKVMLLNATGRYFSSGIDQFEDVTQKADAQGGNTATAVRETHRLQRGMQSILDEMEHVEKPIVAAHHAMCMGGGLEISLSCDFRLAAASAAYAFPEGKFGSLPASNGVSRLTRYCGAHWARWMIMANKPIDAQRALQIGLVHEVWPDDVFEAEVMEFCRHLARQNPEQMGAAKIAIELCEEVGRDSARHIERMANSALFLNPDYAAGRVEYLKGIGNKK